MTGYNEAFQDIPGTVVFDATQSPRRTRPRSYVSGAIYSGACSGVEIDTHRRPACSLGFEKGETVGAAHVDQYRGRHCRWSKLAQAGAAVAAMDGFIGRIVDVATMRCRGEVVVPV